MRTIFIQANQKQYLGAKLAEFSFLKERRARSFEIEILKLQDFPQLYSRQGQSYLRNGKKTVWDNEDLQSFTLLRFLPPQLMNYQGKAIVVDPDVFAFADPQELFNFPLNEKKLACCAYENGEILNYKSSVMLLDCARLKDWNWDQGIAELFSFKRDYRPWMGLRLENPQDLARLPDEWNHCDYLDPKTKFIHYTLRKTQPWKTGLPVDYSYDQQKGLRGRLRALIKDRPERFYLPNPHPQQVKLFFSLTQEALRAGHIKKELIESELHQKHLRPDFFEAMAQYS